jgi:glycosyltransferase involved in cell wall biosynthesis
MKVLFVSAVLPYPLYSGGQIRIYNLLKRLSKRHEIHLYAFIRSESENKYLSKLDFCKSVTTVLRGRAWQPKYLYKTLTNSYPLLWNSYHNSKMQSLLADEIVKGGYDLLHIEPGYVWPSIPTEHRVPIVIAEHNIEHEVYQKYVDAFWASFIKPLLAYDVKKMSAWERESWSSAAEIISVSESDKEKIGRGQVVPNGVDTKSFAFRPKKTMGSPLTFLYVGNFRWMENRDAAQTIIREYWTLISDAYPDAVLRIVGDHAPGGKYYAGKIDNIQQEFNRADILLAPIRIGGGTKYKILEAMATGLPVISSPEGIEGMKGRAMEHYMIAENAQDVLGAISYLSSGDNRLKLVTRARDLIEKEYNWDIIADLQNLVWNSLS